MTTAFGWFPPYTITLTMGSKELLMTSTANQCHSRLQGVIGELSDLNLQLYVSVDKDLSIIALGNFRS
ncbi:hypothetical protein CCGE531_29090 (plasmid) [Rhizobium sp. CCGE531]|nr:hypothetical protein CCGE531_29090 [Rhizobium sp. CCGE531]AYG76478.1 hypothetical protein CCGE532_28565 [Rhizobium sp. CCGE532]